MAEEPNQPNYPIVEYVAGYTAEILRARIIPADNNNESQWKIMIRPHNNLLHSCRNEIDKIPVDDKERRLGDFLIVKYPLRLRKTLSDDPSFTRYLLKCDFDGNEINELGLPDEQYETQLRNAQIRILNLKQEMAMKDKIVADLVEKRDIIDEIKREVRQTIAQEMRTFKEKEKKD